MVDLKKLRAKYGHDAVFRGLMADPIIARDFFKWHLPKKLLKRVDLQSLVLCHETYVDPKLKRSHVDLLYAVTIDGKVGRLYILVEHQSSINTMMPLRVMHYKLKILLNYVRIHKCKPGELPVIYGLVEYNGKLRYSAGTEFFDLFSDKELAKEYFFGPHGLVDVGQISDEELARHPISDTMLFMQKHIRDSDIAMSMRKWKGQFHEFALRVGKEMLKLLLEYGIVRGKTEDEAVQEFVEELVTEETGDDMPTIATLIERKGHREGRQEEWQESRQHIALNLLREGDSLERVARITGLSLQQVSMLQQIVAAPSVH